MSSKPIQQPMTLVRKDESAEKIDDLRGRRTAELIIAFVGLVGSGCTKSAGIVKKLLESQYKYDGAYHIVSSFIGESASSAG